MSDPHGPFDADAQFTLLSSPRRRQLLALLAQADGRAELSSVAMALARGEFGAPITKADYNRVYSSLYQNHIPKLEYHGIIRYDGERQRLLATHRLEELSQLLEGKASSSWVDRYLAIAIVTTLVFVWYLLVGDQPPLTGWIIATVSTSLLALTVYNHTRSAVTRRPTARGDRATSCPRWLSNR